MLYLEVKAVTSVELKQVHKLSYNAKQQFRHTYRKLRRNTAFPLYEYACE